jgi:hypothetical protein
MQRRAYGASSSIALFGRTMQHHPVRARVRCGDPRTRRLAGQRPYQVGMLVKSAVRSFRCLVYQRTPHSRPADMQTTPRISTSGITQPPPGSNIATYAWKPSRRMPFMRAKASLIMSRLLHHPIEFRVHEHLHSTASARWSWTPCAAVRVRNAGSPYLDHAGATTPWSWPHGSRGGEIIPLAQQSESHPKDPLHCNPRGVNAAFSTRGPELPTATHWCQLHGSCMEAAWKLHRSLLAYATFYTYQGTCAARVSTRHTQVPGHEPMVAHPFHQHLILELDIAKPTFRALCGSTPSILRLVSTPAMFGRGPGQRYLSSSFLHIP